MKKPKGGLSGTLESYLELIHELQTRYGAVRVTDLADRMGCKTPSATSALRRLAHLGLINYEAYRPVTLTRDGKAAIRRMSAGHRILADLFTTVLGLPAELAEPEACALEHRISPTLLARIGTFMDFLHGPPGGTELRDALQERFAKYLASAEGQERGGPKASA